MGASDSKAGNYFKSSQFKDLVKRTHFNQNEAKAIYDIFQSVSPDGITIDKIIFQYILRLQPGLFADRIYLVFDQDRDDVLTFSELLIGLSVFSNRGTIDEKLRFSFRIYDFDGDGTIDEDELCRILIASSVDDSMTEEEVKKSVGAMFHEADENGDGRINFDEYRTLMLKHPSVLRQMKESEDDLYDQQQMMEGEG
ncbi:putative Neuronal calcium sensor 1 [Blattamonas nauphoetae]|uniref:Neuronal calcium sensor 1 n=1 Tax=Blattamonas nauphoetae TaxID=2049346 RepID=A0ABQ9XZ46_9EUKA|nr:putative Neuronal calcium sensor 1 [Blattamonas nauphoetae]